MWEMPLGPVLGVWCTIAQRAEFKVYLRDLTPVNSTFSQYKYSPGCFPGCFWPGPPLPRPHPPQQLVGPADVQRCAALQSALPPAVQRCATLCAAAVSWSCAAMCRLATALSCT